MGYPTGCLVNDLSGKPPYLKTARSRTKARTYGYDKAESIQRHCRNYYASITEAVLGTDAEYLAGWALDKKVKVSAICRAAPASQ